MSKGVTSNLRKMIIPNENSNSIQNDDWASPFDLTLPNCKLPDFLNTPIKWRECIFDTNTLHLWCELMTKLENYSPLLILDEDMEIIISCLIEDIAYMHGIITFFSTGVCEDCGLIHSVSIF